MPDTVRTVAALQALLADGQAAGSITPQIIRDMLVSLAHGDAVPSLEELETRALFPTSIAATTTIYLGATNVIQRIGALSFSFTVAIALDTTNYWYVELFRIRANGSPVSVVYQNTYDGANGLAIAVNTAWPFDNAAWVDAARYLLKGDILKLVITKFGAPAALTDGCVAIRYEPGVTAP